MRQYIATLMLIGCALYIKAQNSELDLNYSKCVNCDTGVSGVKYFQYEGLESFTSWDITNDYGRRDCCSTQWHKGLDISPESYNNDIWAIEGLHLDS
ncbi:hypothetical protein SAMN04488028_103238 [Reichenbachiella agariperforans]|uniref:Uncharacterized protein n=1 Tax=Reichenbachiella agariperforans TaxID=156994 RepID=A0A1M6QAA3_REIAG|nr:hypothetical protein SAMN04488028_103238 [Reichenbachiella agariperforans]